MNNTFATIEKVKFGTSFEKPIVLCLGFFDCVHLGHRALIARAQEICKEGIRVAAFTFDNNPFFKRTVSRDLIYSFDERAEIMSSVGVSVLLYAHAGEEFFSMSPTEFVDRLCDNMNITGVVVGGDYTFGKNSSGDVVLLKQLLASKSIPLYVVDAVTYAGERISSTSIRGLLREGDIDTANRLLGLPYRVCGIVQKGRRVGSRIGFPTANVGVGADKVIVKTGVYYTKCKIDGVEYPSVTNVGTHPTFDDYSFNVETHIIWEDEKDRDLYGEALEISFYRYLRDTHKYSSVDELIETIRGDVAHALCLFGEENE